MHARSSRRMSSSPPPLSLHSLRMLPQRLSLNLSQMVRNTDPLTVLGFDATPEVFKATVSALATMIVIGFSLLGDTKLSKAGQASLSPVGGR